MKKSKVIALALITSALASCHKDPVTSYKKNDQKVFMRSDTSAKYSQSHCHSSGISPWLWYYAFRPYGMYNNGSYSHAGYYSSGISQNSNIGTSSNKSNIMRGGFGTGRFSVSS